MKALESRITARPSNIIDLKSRLRAKQKEKRPQGTNANQPKITQPPLNSDNGIFY